MNKLSIGKQDLTHMTTSLEPKYKQNMFIQHRIEDSFHGTIITLLPQTLNGVCSYYIYEISDHGESIFLDEGTIDKYYDVIK